MNLQIQLPEDFQKKIESAAAAHGMSVAEFVRNSLEHAVAQQLTGDSLYSDRAVYTDDAPTDLSARHDDYLYGDAE